MSHIKRKDTKAELSFRKAIWNKGIKGYRIDVNLPGRPDIFFPRYKIAVFIDGCFWHKCPKCYSEPKSNKDYWLSKIDRNVERDKENEIKLNQNDIDVIRFWEHDVKQNLDNIVDEFINAYEKKKNY